MEGIVAGNRETRGQQDAARRKLWTDGRRFWVEGPYGTELGVSVAHARELMASGDYVLKRLSRRTNLGLERRVGDLAEPARRRPRYYPQAAPLPRGGGDKQGI